MNIWIISVGEPMPFDSGNTRLHRSGLLSQYFSEKGHKVAWITSTFDHAIKKNRFSKDTIIKYNENIEIHCLHTIVYKNNVGVTRLFSNFVLAFKTYQYLKKISYPDRIISSYPILDLAFVAVYYGKKFGVPVLVDVRDLWPDIFLRIFNNRFLRFLARICAYPYFLTQKYIFEKATSLVSITESMLQFCQRKVYRNERRDLFFHLAYPIHQIMDSNINKFQEIISHKRSGKVIISFFGNMSLPTCRLDHLFLAAQKNPTILDNYCIVFCGNGQSKDYFVDLYKDYSNVYFPGFLDATDISTLMSFSDLGFLPYESSFDFQMSLPNKFVEYLSGGLPVLTCLKGEVQLKLNEVGSGYFYNTLEDLTHILKQRNLYLQDGKREEILKYFQENFSSDNIYAKYVSHVEELI